VEHRVAVRFGEEGCQITAGGGGEGRWYEAHQPESEEEGL
jgi:hypothetical protein